MRAEHYLTWLLSTRTKTLPEGTRIILDATFETTGRKKLSEIKSATLRPQPFHADQPLMRDVSVREQGEVERAKALNILRAAGVDDTSIAALAADSTTIELSLQIKFKDSRSVKPIESATIGRLFRNIPEDELTLEGPAGRERDGKIVKLAFPVEVLTAGMFLDRRDVALKLYEAYNYFRSHGHIAA